MEVIYLFGAVALVNCAYYFIFSKFAFTSTSEPRDTGKIPVSLVVCAKNEGENLERHIPMWLAQNHPDFEIILIDDASTDNTLDVMEHFAAQDARIQVVRVENNETFWGSKKYALTLGIKRAKNNHMVFTDADCQPASESWLVRLASNFSNEKQLVLGYGAYHKKKGFLNRLIRFETLMTAIQYFSYAKIGTPYMGVGRNLAYTSELYYANRGFINHIKIRSGDDDLFVNETATATNTALCVDPEAFTYSLPKKSIGAWIRQKQRHYTTARYYKPIHKFLLGVYSTSLLLFWALIPVAFYYGKWEYATGILAVRFLAQYISIGKSASKLKESGLVLLIPFWELVLIVFQFIIFISKRKTKNIPWK